MTGTLVQWWVVVLLLPFFKKCSSSEAGGNDGSPKSTGDDSTIVSSLQCVGETFLPEAWTFRTCRFWNLCWRQSDFSTFSLFPSPEEWELRKAFEDLLKTMTDEEALKARNLVTVSSSSLISIPHVSLQSIYNEKHDGLPWFPLIADTQQMMSSSTSLLSSATQITRLPSSVVVVPIVWTSDDLNKKWKDYFAIYTALSMFGLSDDAADAKIVLVDVKTKPNLTSPPISRWEVEIFGDHRTEVSGDANSVLCASSAVAGLGRIAATSLNEEHRKEGAHDDFLSHSIFRGIGIFKFRNFVLKRLDIDTDDAGAGMTDPICLCNNTEKGLCKLCAYLEKFSSWKSKGYRIITLDDHASLRMIASTGMRSQKLVIDGSNQLILPLATFLPRNAALVVVGPTTEKKFLKTWSHVRLDFVNSVESLFEYEWDI